MGDALSNGPGRDRLHNLAQLNRVDRTVVDLHVGVEVAQQVGERCAWKPWTCLVPHFTRLIAKRDRGTAEAERFLAEITDRGGFLLDRVSLVFTGREHREHVPILHDPSDDLAVQAEHEQLFNALLEQVRRPAAATGALLDIPGDVLDIRPLLRNGSKRFCAAGFTPGNL